MKSYLAVFVFLVIAISAVAAGMTVKGDGKNCTPPCCIREPKGQYCDCLIETAGCTLSCIRECVKGDFKFDVICATFSASFTGCLESGRIDRTGMTVCCESDQELYDQICSFNSLMPCESSECLYKMRDLGCWGW